MNTFSFRSSTGKTQVFSFSKANLDRMPLPGPVCFVTAAIQPLDSFRASLNGWIKMKNLPGVSFIHKCHLNLMLYRFTTSYLPSGIHEILDLFSFPGNSMVEQINCSPLKILPLVPIGWYVLTNCSSITHSLITIHFNKCQGIIRTIFQRIHSSIHLLVKFNT